MHHFDRSFILPRRKGSRYACAPTVALILALSACTPALPPSSGHSAATEAKATPSALQATFDTAEGIERIEPGLAAAQAWLDAGEVQRAGNVLEKLADIPGTIDQQARYAVLMAETRLAQNRPLDARRWLERGAEGLPASWQARRLRALDRMAEANTPAPSAESVALPDPNTHLVATLLPVSGRWSAAGQAIQDGILRAYLEESPSRRPTLRFFPVTEQSVSVEAAARDALALGARSVIGPLDKAMVEKAAAVIPPSVPMIALNRIDQARPGLFQFGLPPEDEARIVAQQAMTLGHRRAWVIAPASEWGTRLHSAFGDTFAAQGGEVLHITRYDAAQSDFQAALREGLAQASDADMIFLAAFMFQAQLLQPQIRFVGGGNLPIYATSAVYGQPAKRDGSTDLNGVRFPDMPWLLSADPAVAPAVARLQALGIDAYRVWHQLASVPQPDAVSMVGATGTLALDSDGRIIRRDLPWAHFSDGTVQPGLPVEDAPVTVP
ncbi:penicillin-binding protein activator [Candidatus Macondimonas diazotrophica]|jgi:outer membrane PBP1 activator LpoA protein|uniref:Penicillin-binding protein activator n=1 Tax=Candidatus Macondimonas diazotrophica TaxID=2305248 RepID=A0A4Z0FAR0_9GAMM|nr:penicillin-binding protein activator [Candidatus Macondimonas diazotrophica]NCU00228.1 penicillin-binding protein activator [Candidatus Macondimonas diazotrophica]TFZ83021.1 penicillin-binding protein activator [Candidatus Macondimonas diazotrophica]HBG29386.1 hypothetical protein [Gammaproteobacteria bacterium]HBG51268.1 hypothetical protein [Gammaproteobacteria bacterium]